MGHDACCCFLWRRNVSPRRRFELPAEDYSDDGRRRRGVGCVVAG